MAKNIVICSDGTGNTAIKGRGTNVFKLFEAVDLNGHRTDPSLTPQVAIYDDGVGTEGFEPLKIFAGATGFGLARNVRQLYKELVRIYDPGDRIFLFGFSRGAFTVRTLAGFISRCGMLDLAKFDTASALEDGVDLAYKTYRRYYRTELAALFLGKPDTSKTAQFREQYCLPGPVPMAFLGVWDTVDAVGTPFHITEFINLAIYRFKFPDNQLCDTVERACQALAIDEARDAFAPVLWRHDPRVEQVWFAGVHSNVGGGYLKQGMSLVALDWMMYQASQSGLRILATDRILYSEHGNVDDKLYDSRAGLGVFYRWLPRDIAGLCQAHEVPPRIHLSALERIAHGTADYAPGNLPPHAHVVITPTGDAGKDAAAHRRAKGVERVLHAAHGDGRPLLSKVGSSVKMGRVSYYLYLLSCVAVLLAASVQFRPLIEGVMRLATVLQWAGGIAAGLLLSYFLILAADRRMSAVFSHFWHHVQPDLRTALKTARQEPDKGAFAQRA